MPDKLATPDAQIASTTGGLEQGVATLLLIGLGWLLVRTAE